MMHAAGGRAEHIVACSLMAEDLRRCYAGISSTRIISGVVALDTPASGCPVRSELRSVGFLSNVSREKGIFEFLDVVEALRGKGVNVDAFIVGAFHNDATRAAVMNRVSRLAHVQYVGPKFGADKYRFLDSIDLLMFPTWSESDGLVVHEAMSRGVPVVAYGRGCINQTITSDSGKVIDATGDYVAEAVHYIQSWCELPGVMERLSLRARQRFEALKAHHDQALSHFVRELAACEQML
jgi:glycosyltransferase involved in cell wall biosynthesis